MMKKSKKRSSSLKYRKGSDAKYACSVVENDDDDAGFDPQGTYSEEGLSISATTFMTGGRQTAFPGGPFSALTPSMCPQDILARIQLDESRDQPERYDEFGFKVKKQKV